jgi:hypothetical protein
MAYNAGFDLGSLTPIVNGFLEDHQADLASYLTAQVCRPEKVDDPKGILERWETPVEMASEEGTTSQHAPGTSTPKGNTQLGAVPFQIESFSWAEPVNHLAKRALESRKQAFSKLAGRGAHQVKKDIDKMLATICKADGLSAKSQDVTAKAATAAFDHADGVPITDIDSVVSALRGAQSGLICVAGWDVLLKLTKNVQMVNNVDAKFIGVPEVIELIMSRGISRVYVDYNPMNANAANQARDYKGILDGVFYIGTRDNLVMPYVNPLSMDMYEDADARIQYLRAAEDMTIVREYKEHGYGFTGI